MAICMVKDTVGLEENLILTPERYNPNRKLNILHNVGSRKIKELVEIINDVVNPAAIKKHSQEHYIVNTSNAMEGFIHKPELAFGINSSKKRAMPGDIIISRLRPYLRQVAYIDRDMLGIDDFLILVSTEFFVLRSRDNESIAFLIPFLLSTKVQDVFQSSVEGSQHPRFKESDLINLDVPKKIITERTAVSGKIEQLIKQKRHADIQFDDLVKLVGETL